LYVLWRKVFGIRGEDVFIVHNGLTAILCALFRCLYIIDLHGKEIGSNISRRIVGKYPPVFWIVQSILLKDYLINDINVLESKILLSRNAVNYIFDTKEIDGLTLNREQHSIAYIGRLMPQMGYGILLNALNEYTKPRCVKVVMAGDHSRHTEYFDRISKGYPKASQQVVFTGFINEHEIEWLSRNVNAFLLLYSSEFYLIGALSPMKLFEYLKYNKPIIAPNIKDIFEVVEYYGCEDRMIWYEMDDAASLGRAFVKLVDDPPVRIKAVQIETWDNKAEQIVEFLIKNKNKVRGLES
jgi:glycosyltransferase involved in cell wall biosynthesis